MELITLITWDRLQYLKEVEVFSMLWVNTRQWSVLLGSWGEKKSASETQKLLSGGR